jgi:hypothetical protein
LHTLIKRDGDGNGKYIVARDVRIYLEVKPIASQKAIVCRCQSTRLIEWDLYKAPGSSVIPTDYTTLV